MSRLQYLMAMRKLDGSLRLGTYLSSSWVLCSEIRLRHLRTLTTSPAYTKFSKGEPTGSMDSKPLPKASVLKAAGPQEKNLQLPDNIWKNPKPTALGPGASKSGKYKVPEYYCYNKFSYFEMEIVMAKSRNPQPNSRPKKEEPEETGNDGGASGGDKVGLSSKDGKGAQGPIASKTENNKGQGVMPIKNKKGAQGVTPSKTDSDKGAIPAKTESGQGVIPIKDKTGGQRDKNKEGPQTKCSSIDGGKGPSKTSVADIITTAINKKKC